MKTLCYSFSSVYFLLYSVSFSICQEQDSCDRMKEHCDVFVHNAIIRYPNYADLRTKDLVQLFGYPVEEHTTTTKDGYILNFCRIPFSTNSPNIPGKTPVLIMHGLLGASSEWFWNGIGANNTLIFMLADAGYDVWLGNARGTSYSQTHVSLPSDDPLNLDYWDFSFHEMAKYDVPAVLDYITSATNQPNIYYIGHSMGVTQFFAAMTLEPRYNSKIRTMFAMAPAVFTGNATSRHIRMIAPLMSRYQIMKAANEVGGGRILPKTLEYLVGSLLKLCPISVINCGFCSNLYFQVAGFSPCHANFFTIPGYLAHNPDVGSVKSYSHISQGTVTGTFREYDYGSRINRQRYGQSTPPDYDLSKVDVPVVLISGKSDGLVVPKDVAKLKAALGSNVKEDYQVSVSDWTHADFVGAKDADFYVYNKIIGIMNQHKYDRVI